MGTTKISVSPWMLMTVLTWPLAKSGSVMLAESKARDLEELIRLYEAGQLEVARRRVPRVVTDHRLVDQLTLRPIAVR